MADNLDHVSIVVQNTFQSFLTLGERVHIALRTQLGDAARLMEQKRLCLQFLDSISQVSYHAGDTFLTLY
jgi:hypothetical protein